MNPIVSIITPVKARNATYVGWLDETIASIQGQTSQDWEMIVVNDHSKADLTALKAKWHNIRWLDATDHGVSAARNEAAAAARAPLLLPLDADDKLTENAVEVFLQAWQARGDARIIYSDVVMFGENYSRVYTAPGYDFKILLKGTFMTIGCLHLKEDWEKVGGWRNDMQAGLEDWEYWIALGEIGVCGARVNEPLYYYRRHAGGRLANLKSDQEVWQTAYQRMRDLHTESYNGRWPVGCCGSAAVSTAKGKNQRRQEPLTLDRNRAAVAYMGRKAGAFWVSGAVTQAKYNVPGIGALLEDGNGRPGVDPRDVAMLISMHQGRIFKLLPKPKPAQPPVNVEQALQQTAAAFDPAVMEDTQPETPSLPNVASLTLRVIKELTLTPEQAQMMLMIEKEGKARKTVMAHLKRIAGG